MIPKKDKPKILDNRPIAVTVNSNKIVCTILRKKIDEFLESKGVVYRNQFGFTEGGRVEHCMFMLDYIANMTYEKVRKSGHSLFFAFVDFKKAYDSIDRQKLIEVLVSFNINPVIIELIVQMYKEDCTIIKLGRMNKKVEVTSGIRQGCSISTLLFKLVTFRIIDKLREKRMYRIRKFCDNSLWLADDATIIADSMENMIDILDCLNTEGGVFGLEINKDKTKIMKIRGPDNFHSIGSYEIVKETKYLGITIGGFGRNIFDKSNSNFISKAREKVNTLIAQIRKSVDMVLVGKAIWKLMYMPALLFGRAIIPTSEANIQGLQRQENRVWRFLMGIGGYSAVDALRGEMGASLVESRIMETVLLYALDTIQGKFENIKSMMNDTMEVGKGRWYSSVSKYLNELNLQWKSLESLPRKELKAMVREYDTVKWRQGLLGMKTQIYYCLGKKKMGYDYCYRNTYDSTFFAKARLNSLKLEDQIGRGKRRYDKTCKLCGRENEDMVHFIIKCPALESDRDHDLMDSRLTNPQEKMVNLLFGKSNPREVGGMIRRMWHRRRSMLTFIKKGKEKYKIPPRVKRIGGNDYGDPHQDWRCSDPGPVRKVSFPYTGRSM